jgi:hypothetical protein
MEGITITELTDKYYNGFKFETKKCTAILVKTSPTIVALDVFVCDDNVRGEGRALLLNALKYIHEKDKNIDTIMLESVPHTDVYRKAGLTKAAAQKKLNAYYQRLGFTTTDEGPNSFKTNVMELIQKIEEYRGGGQQLRLRSPQLRLRSPRKRTHKQLRLRSPQLRLRSPQLRLRSPRKRTHRQLRLRSHRKRTRRYHL